MEKRHCERREAISGRIVRKLHKIASSPWLLTMTAWWRYSTASRDFAADWLQMAATHDG